MDGEQLIVTMQSVSYTHLLPQITVRLKEGNTIYRFTASFDGTYALPEKAVKLIDSEGRV